MAAELLGDYALVEGFEALKALAHPIRLQILRQLHEGPRTAAEVGRALDLAPQKAGYHIKKMEAAGLVRFVRSGRSRWKEERLYEATARQYIVDPALACDDAGTRAALQAELEVRFREARREQILGGGLERIASRAVGEVLDLRSGQRLLVLSGPFSLELVDALLVATEARGAAAVQHSWGRSYILGRLDAHGDEELARQELFPRALTDSIDAVVQVTCTIPQGAPPNPEQRAKLPHLMRAVSDWQRELRSRGIPFLEVSLPTSRDFEGFSSPELGMDTFWRAMDQDPDSVERRLLALTERLDAAETITIRDGRGGLLELELCPAPESSPAGRHLSPGLPCGARTRRVRAGTASGEALAAYTMVQGRRVLEPALTLAEGQLVRLAGGEGIVELERRIDAESGDVRALAFISIGASRIGSALTGKTSLDGIVEGVVTLGFGSDNFLGGDRSASLDLRFPLAGATLEADGVALVSGGRLHTGGEE